MKAMKEKQPRSDPTVSSPYHSCSTCKHAGGEDDDDESSSSSSSSSSTSETSDDSSTSSGSDSEAEKSKRKLVGPKLSRAAQVNPEVNRKRSHPAGLHPDLAFNEPGQMNDGPFCRCSWLARQTGVRHSKFAGEEPIPKCDPNSNNLNSLHHYVLQASPSPGQFSRKTTSIDVDGVVYGFEGFSLLFHHPLADNVPKCLTGWKLGTNGPTFELHLTKENAPESFTVADLELFHTFLFDGLLELYDLRRLPSDSNENDSCPVYHCMPRFVRKLKDSGKELLPMSTVLQHLTDAFIPLMDDAGARRFQQEPHLFREFSHQMKDQLLVNPSKVPQGFPTALNQRFLDVL